MTVSNARLAIIGVGAMGSAIAKGLLGLSQSRSENEHAKDIVLYDNYSKQPQDLEKNFGFKVADSLGDLVKEPLKQLIIAVKPQSINELLEALQQEAFGKGTSAACTIISIAAGTEIKTFEKFFPNNPIIRVMPNTPCQIGKGASVLASNTKCSQTNIDEALMIFKKLGIAIVLDESKLNAVTALSGSGPAYFYLLVEAMTAAGIELGLDPESARLLAEHTGYGACSLLTEGDKTASELRKLVASPGGTTEAALKSFEANHFTAIVKEALKAAEARGQGLAA
jgi:pyrroline-5-carboxylate reductase